MSSPSWSSYASAVVFAFVLVSTSVSRAEPDARQRQAAAEAYDQGTAAYVARDYEKAAQWYETANRLAPAAPALIQSARAHFKAGNLPRSATLALRLTVEYPDDATASEVGNTLLGETVSKLVRVDVMCEGCSLDLDGTLQDFPSFFIVPESEHTVTASFETGNRSEKVSGAAGETKTLSFEAPPPPPVVDEPEDSETPEPSNRDPETGEPRDEAGKPLPPLVTFIGAGVTAALLAGAIVSRLDTNGTVDDFESAADAANASCASGASDCLELYDEAQGLLEDGESKDTRTTVLWVATGAAGAATLAIALLLTDWSSDDEAASAQRLSFAIAPTLERGEGIRAQLTGRF